MKTKKQLAAAAAAAAASPPATPTASDKKPSATSAATATAPASTTPTTPSSSAQTVAVKKSLKRLQPKAKDSPSPKAVPEATSSGTAVVPAKPKPASKPAPKNEVKSKKVPAGAGSKSKPPAVSAPPKKIQKELKNLGITDRAINQIDTAIVECNPSISEMVKTKSRATVSQLKYSDLGGGTSAKPVATAGSSEVQKSVEPPTVVSSAVPVKKRPPPKTKDDSAKIQQDVGREEAGGAKNKTPVTALATPSNSATATNPAAAAAKEDVKAGPSNVGAKSKAKRPENKDDNDGQQGGGGGGGAAAEQKSSPAKKNPTVVAVAAAKPKPKSKKAILEEKRAAEAAAAAAAAVAAAVASAEVEQTTMIQEVAVTKQRTLPLEDKNDEEKPCSLELDQDDKNESDVQSRIEDIMKALEESDGDEGPPVSMLLPVQSSKEEGESNVEAVQQVVDQNQENKPTKVAAKPKVTAVKKKAPAKKKPVDDTPSIDQSKQESPASKSEDDKSIKKTPTSQVKRKYVRKPSGGQTSKNKVEHKTPSEPVDTDEPKVDPSPETPPEESQNSEKAPVMPTPPEEPTESLEHPKTIRSSTENDDDVPLNRLKDKTTPKPPESTPESSFPVPNAPLLAALLTPSPATSKTKRKYVRKPSSTPTSGGKKKPSSKVATQADAKDKKPEKKDVYDFDDSDSENDSPVKAGKPFFKTTRKPLETSSAKEEEEDTEEAPQAGVALATPDPLESKSELDPLKESDSDEEKELKKPAKKPAKSRNTPKQPSSEEDSDDEDDKDADPDERPLTPMSKKIKREVRDSSEESNGDSDSSEESVRTRIVKKQLTAKTRHLKLYGFWSGPKRHRVASLNAIAKVHCLYENETRAALEASLMKQGPPRARAATSKEVKKETIEESEKKEESKEESKSDKKEESESKVKQREEKATKEESKKKACKKTEPKEVKKKETKKVVVKEEKKEDKKKSAERQKQASESDSESEESSEEEVVTRTLRCVPGLRGAGKHWDPNASSMESEGDVLPDSDETYAQGKDTDPVKKRKVKRKVIKKAKPKPKAEKAEKPKPPVKKIKKEAKNAPSDNEKKSDDESSGSDSESEKPIAAPKPKAEEVKKRKREPKEKKEIVESMLGKKRMASLNATAMLAATYEVQRILYRNTDSDSDSPAEKPKPKKVKEQKESKEQKEAAKAEAKREAKEQKESKEEGENASEAAKAAEKEKAKEQKEKEKEKEKAKEKEKEKEKEPLITVKTEPNRERREELEVKREIEEPRPVSSNLVIAQDTEVTITGVYVNSSLGANQEAYCKMQYRVQQSVTEERLVRPGEAPPKSYTPLTALSSMRPPNDQTLATPPLFGPPSQCDSPLGLGPRSFYPPPTSSSGSSSAFCAPIPHGSPGYYQPAGPLISPHLLAQPIPVSQHSSSSSTITKQPPESDSPGVSSLVQPPSSSTADSTDSDVLLTAGDLSSRSQQAAAAAAAAAYRYGPSGPPNLYPRPVQMHCPPPHLAPNYYAAPPYSQYPPEMYYTHAAYPPAHFYPKFAQYYPPSRRYYPAPVSGEHLYEQPPPPPSAGGPVPPPAGAQLVPAGPPQGPPPPPQHLEHYPGPPPYPYPGYGSPGPGPGGQCYSRNAYMDAHYTTNCPCPMQSCPKNVNAGSLIGIKASKGPVTTTATPTTPHHIASSTAAPNSTAVQMSPSSTCTTMACSTEPIVISSGSSTSSSPPPLDIHSPIVASEPVVSSTVTTTVATATTTTTTEPNTNTAKVKPERDLHQYNSYHYHYPHRPSAPPPTHPLHSSYIPVSVVDVKQEPAAPTLESPEDSKTTKNIPKLLPLVVKQEITEVKQEPQPVTMTVVSCKKEDFEENGPAMTPDLLLDEALIKKEALVTELVHHTLDDKRILSDILTAEANLITSKTLDNLNVSSNNQNINNNNSSSISNEKVQLVDSILPEIPASTVKRRPLLVACKKSTPKKSPPNSYKNLIKRTNLGGDGQETPTGDDEPTITVLSDDDDELEEEDDEVVVTTTPVSRNPKRPIGKPRKLLKRTRRVFGAEQLRHLQKLNRSVLGKTKRVRRLVKRPSCVPSNPAASDVPAKEPEPLEPVQIPELPEEPSRPMSNVDLTIDLVAKGYFSEPEIASKIQSRAMKRLKQQEGRSQSEQKRGSSKKAKQQQQLNVDKCPKVTLDMAEQSKGKKAKKRSAPKSSKHNGKKRATSTPLPPEVVDQPEVTCPPLDTSAIEVEPTVAAAADATIDDRETDFDDAATMLVDDDVMAVDTNTMINRHNNNNNNSTVENKNAAAGTDPLEDPLTVEPTPTCATTVELSAAVEDRLPTATEDVVDEDDEEEEIMLARRFAKKSGTGLKSRTSRSRSKSKSRKFSIKKRHRPARVPEVEEIIVPRKSNSVPRWSNGWTWEGQPFQGKVFLNSDDPPVTRTCYPAMRHSEGDIIRPRDSVLLRAGSKRAELPYVAKVAHLWENPEDGEMMMSLLWYYRPEHTEQGRQPVDGPDEVFASRHKDHNSVACIEDKCYVLTFSEYCRFRRQLRGFEENIDEQPSIVPPLRRENPRLPPSIVAPELVMYCQRVYEFRLKRLLKQPS